MAYEGPARALVGAWKERGLRPVANLAAELVTAHVERPAADVITCVPPDPVRQLTRGDHPARRLAAKLAARWEIDSASLVRRRAAVGRQAALRLEERRRNVRGAFAADPLGPLRVVLVDDVYTTGATVDAAAKALRAAGAARVEVVTFARAVR